jgi:hypothetical protein
MFRVWHCNCNAKLSQILHESFEFGTAIAKANLLDIQHASFEFGSAIEAPTC